ncbi:MAG: hypothetical protein IJ225_07755 [Solobacterium sp.]|nr:hypothetical protein [Solobacterium sp.]
MSIFVESLREDLDRVHRNIEAYQRRISELPKGSLMVRHISGHDYIYLKYRIKDKVIQKYVSTFTQERYDMLMEEIEQRNQFQQELRLLIQEEKDMKRALKSLGG